MNTLRHCPDRGSTAEWRLDPISVALTVVGLVVLFFGSPFLADMKLDSSGHQRLALWIGFPLNVIMSVVVAAIALFFIVASSHAH